MINQWNGGERVTILFCTSDKISNIEWAMRHLYRDCSLTWGFSLKWKIYRNYITRKILEHPYLLCENLLIDSCFTDLIEMTFKEIIFPLSRAKFKFLLGPLKNVHDLMFLIGMRNWEEGSIISWFYLRPPMHGGIYFI